MKFPRCLVLLLIATLSAGGEMIREVEGRFTIESVIGNKRIFQDVYYSAPRQIKRDAPVVIVMHGNLRNADRYRDEWKRHAGAEKLIVLVPEFSEKNFPGSQSYNLAGMLGARNRLNSQRHWTFPLIDQLFLAVKKEHRLNSEQFYLYGHSAGAQFVHRYAMFANSERLGLAIAANAGWYTFPTMIAGFPYGIKGMSTAFDATITFSADLVVLLGSADTDPNHKYLRKTKAALLQGENRFERGKSYFRAARESAEKQGITLNWRQQIVPGVGHSNRRMSKAALAIIREAALLEN